MKNPITIEVSLYNVPEELLSDNKFGLYKRLLNKNGIIIDDLRQEDDEDNLDVLTIKLVVSSDLEPKWYVANNRKNQDDVEIRAGDRAKFNVFLVSDYLERHFAWNRGNPLYALIKEEGITDEKGEILTKAYRDAKNSVKKDSFNYLDGVTQGLKESAESLGVSVNDISTSIDFRDIFVRDGKVSLHSDEMPFRLKGKGTKRLLSIAIQLELAKQGGIILIDELEQGLEPDRARFVAKALKEKTKGQVFITTHSSNILVELTHSDIFLRTSQKTKLVQFNKTFQGCLRNNPEAFFGKKIIVCEGATEVGICRALNNFLIAQGKPSLALLGIVVVDGKGTSFKNYVLAFNNANFDVCVFCDSDRVDDNKYKKLWGRIGITVVDCQESYAMEEQLFSDLPWDSIVMLLNYLKEYGKEQSLTDSTGKTFEELVATDKTETRMLLGEKSKEKEWYKRIDHGEFIGGVWFNSLDKMKDKQLNKQFDTLTSWIKNEPA